MSFRELPHSAAWRHVEARDGFEVAFPQVAEEGRRLDGVTAAVESGNAWTVHYSITLDAGWRTRSGRLQGHTAEGVEEIVIETDGGGAWRVDGRSVPELDGCLDLDLESSSLTNAFPVRRLALEVGERAEAPAAYVRAAGLSVERLEQSYVRLEDGPRGQRYHYESPAFGFEAELAYDESGLVLDYPGIAVRAA
jgi:uncharacterized protein